MGVKGVKYVSVCIKTYFNFPPPLVGWKMRRRKRRVRPSYQPTTRVPSLTNQTAPAPSTKYSSPGRHDRIYSTVYSRNPLQPL